MKKFILGLAAMLAVIGSQPVEAQYFGQNKVQYDTFDFRILETEHFEIYYYEEKADIIDTVAAMAEWWYERLSTVLDYDLPDKQRIILYASHPDFRQTNTISGQVGETTGGVTEAFKRRVVLPMAGPLAETKHVLGHELVHAFQFAITSQQTSSSVFALPGALRLPLWFMEGMAEYLSVGSVDAHTAMWIRSALAADELPTIDDLWNPAFFPYRYGHAVWAFIGGRHGDAAIGQILKAAGRTGAPEDAFRQVLGLSLEELSEAWHESIRSEYDPILAATRPAETFGRRIFDDDDGQINVSPAVSPDGQRVVFFSERSRFSIDLFVADVASGRILRKLTETVTDPHIESLQFISSAGAWSRDGRWFAYGATASGHARLTVVEPDSGRRVEQFDFPELDEIFSPTWSPDGDRIAFTAISGGIIDLFVLDRADGSFERLTRDPFVVLHPAWSPDGRTIAFSTDRFSSNLDALTFGAYRIGLLDLETGEIRPALAEGGRKQINPEWSGDGRSLYYLDDAGGVTNVYRVDLATGAATALTNVQTGVTGITALSPALSVPADGLPVVSIFEDDGYQLYQLAGTAADGALSPDRQAGRLPPSERIVDTVGAYLAEPWDGSAPRIATRDYSAGISLDYVAPPTISAGMSSYGATFGGGIALYWSDMLGNHNMMTAIELQSEGSHFMRGLAGAVAYENRKHRWSWGGMLAQMPYVSGSLGLRNDFVDGQPVVIEREIRQWEIHRNLIGTTSYPFSRALRFELSGGLRQIGFESEQRTFTYFLNSGQIRSEEITLPSPDSLTLGVSTGALVYDQSVFGGTGPVLGQRYRFEGSTTLGDLSYRTALADFRRYVMPFRPVTLAGRLLHFGRYGGGAEDPRLQDIFLGDEYLIRGYDLYSFDGSDCAGALEGSCPAFDQLVGTRIGVANLEARLPLLGPLGIITEAALPVEIAAFLDAGSAWRSGQTPHWLGGDAGSVTSHGVSLRFNLMGFAIGQLSFVHPNDRPNRNWMWQFSFTQGF